MFRENNSPRDGRLTVLLVITGCFLIATLVGNYLKPRLISTGPGRCEQLGVSSSGQLLIKNCNEVAGRDDDYVPSHLTPFFYHPVKINMADREMLETVKGVGPSLAEKILTHRRLVGSFKKPADLQKLSGVGRKKAAAIAAEFNFFEVP